MCVRGWGLLAGTRHFGVMWPIATILLDYYLKVMNSDRSDVVVID